MSTLIKPILASTLIACILICSQCKTSEEQHVHNYMEHTKFARYKASNQKLKDSAHVDNRVVFMGNSITDMWPTISPQFFENNNYIGRGIGGQTTPQMLLRFRQDVVNLDPRVVVILAGINDIAGNTGHTPIENIAENIISMAELARENNIVVVLCSVLPALDFPWRPGLKPAPQVIALNALLKSYAAEHGIIYVDYHGAMKDENNGLRVPEYTTKDDLVHPNAAGYKAMEKLLQPAITKALKPISK